MKRLKLTVEKRKVLGKKVTKLRKMGILPANIYGKNIKSLAVQVPQKEFDKVFKEVGETGLVEVEVNGEIKPVLIHNVQFDPLTRLVLHADFYQVDLKQKVKAIVPVTAVGEAKAVIDKVGILLQPLAEVEVEALPVDLPEHIEIDVSLLAVIDEQITVGDLKLPEGVSVLTDPSQIVVKIAELVTKEAEKQAATETAAAEAAKATSDVAKAEATVEAGEVVVEAEAPPQGKETPAPPPKTEKK